MGTIILVIIAGFFLLPIVLPKVWKLFLNALKFWFMVIFVLFTIAYYFLGFDKVIDNHPGPALTPEQAQLVERMK